MMWRFPICHPIDLTGFIDRINSLGRNSLMCCWRYCVLSTLEKKVSIVKKTKSS